MVIYGKLRKTGDGMNRSSKCIHGGAAFVWPFIQAYEFLDLTPISISVDLKMHCQDKIFVLMCLQDLQLVFLQK